MLCECEALTSLRHVCLGSFLLEPADVKSVNLGAIWNFVKSNGSHELIWGTKGLSVMLYVHRDHKVSNPIVNQSINIQG